MCRAKGSETDLLEPVSRLSSMARCSGVSKQAKAKLEADLVEIAGINRTQSIMSLRVLQSEIERFGKLIFAKLS